MLFHPLCSPYKYLVYEVAEALADIKVIMVYHRSDSKRYRLMPKRGLRQLDKTKVETPEVKTGSTKSRNEENGK